MALTTGPNAAPGANSDITSLSGLTGVIATPTEITASDQQIITITNGGNTTITDELFLKRNLISGTPAAGFGGGLAFNLQDSTTTNQPAASIEVAWSDANHATHASYLDFKTTTGGSAVASVARLFGSGGLSVNSTTDPGAGIVNANSGLRIGNAAASGKILKGDGTNFVASTETYAAPGTTGNLLTSDGTNWTSAAPAAGGGTVTHTGGALTSNAVVLGAGAADTKVVAGIITDGTAKLTLGVNTTTLGQVKLFGNTSGDATVQPAAIAGTATVVTLPNASSTLPIYPQQITYTGPTAARTKTLRDATDTILELGGSYTPTGTWTNMPLANPTVTTGLTVSSAPLTLSGNQSVAAWTTNGVRIKGVTGTLTDTTSSGTVAAAYTDVLGGNTIAASSATTFTDYYALYLKDSVVGTNVTLTNKWAIGGDSAKFGTSNALTISSSGVLTAVAPVLGTPTTLVGTNITGTGASFTAGNATKWTTGRTIAITGDVTYTSGALDGSGNVTGTGTVANMPVAATYATDLTALPKNTGGWNEYAVITSDYVSGTALADITGLVSGTLSASTKYEILIELDCVMSADTNGGGIAVVANGTGATGVVSVHFTASSSSSTAMAIGRLDTSGTSSAAFGLASAQTASWAGGGFVTTRSTGTITISVQAKHVTTGTTTIKTGSKMWIRKAKV